MRINREKAAQRAGWKRPTSADMKYVPDGITSSPLMCLTSCSFFIVSVSLAIEVASIETLQLDSLHCIRGGIGFGLGYTMGALSDNWSLAIESRIEKVESFMSHPASGIGHAGTWVGAREDVCHRKKSALCTQTQSRVRGYGSHLAFAGIHDVSIHTQFRMRFCDRNSFDQQLNS